MDHLPRAVEAVIDERKLTEYLLSLEHPLGRTKARFFISFGFDRRELWTFRSALLEHAHRGMITRREASEYGIKYIVDGPLRTPDGREPAIRSIWLVAVSGGPPRFITAYPIGD